MTNSAPAKTARFATTAIAALMAATMGATTFIADANAGRRERLFLGGVAAGVIATTIIASEARQRREAREHRSSRWERHVRRCYNAYDSYDEDSDTYIDYNGNERRCRK